MRPKVYIETTIPSYLAARPSRDLVTAGHQQITRQWWDFRRSGFDSFVSELVLQECEAGDATLARRRLEIVAGMPLLALTPTIRELAKDMVAGGPIPERASADAFHIATATAYACEYLLTWNCRHIANAEITRLLRPWMRARGFDLPAICTPEELMGEDAWSGEMKS